MISIIAALDINNGIGFNNRLLCHLPDDLKRFKRITTGHTIIMGWNTYLSLPIKPLPNRKNIVLCDIPNAEAPGCILVSSMEEAILNSNWDGEKFIIGGAMVYKQFFPLAQKLYITRIYHEFKSDAWFPDIDPFDWQLQSSERHKADETEYPYSYEIYVATSNN